MYGLVVIGIALLYIAFCLCISIAIGRWLGKRKGEGKGWLWGVAILLLINIPVLYETAVPAIAKPFYCEGAGFWLYKTPEQWKTENLGVAETLIRDGEQVDGKLADGRYGRVFHLNQRFDWQITGKSRWNNIVSKEELVLDRQTGEVMARKIDHGWNLRRPLRIAGAGTCFKKDEREKWKVSGHGMRIYMEEFQQLGEQQ